MTAESVVAISAGVVAATQLVKWAGLPDKVGPIIVMLFAALGVGLWLFSQQAWPPARTDTWNIASGWISVTLAAAGTFGFTRAAVGAVTRATPPPVDGAGSADTVPSVSEIADELERRSRTSRVRTVS